MIIKHLNNELVLIKSESRVVIDYALKRDKKIEIEDSVIFSASSQNNKTIKVGNIKVTPYFVKNVFVFLVEVENNKILVTPNFTSHPMIKKLVLKYEHNLKNYNILITNNQIEFKSNIVSPIENNEFKLNDKNLELVSEIFRYFNDFFENKNHLEYIINYKNRYNKIYQNIYSIIFRYEIIFDDFIEEISEEITKIIISNQKITHKKITKIFHIYYESEKLKINEIIQEIDKKYKILKERR